jgi:hypothetical protein
MFCLFRSQSGPIIFTDATIRFGSRDIWYGTAAHYGPIPTFASPVELKRKEDRTFHFLTFRRDALQMSLTDIAMQLYNHFAFMESWS